MNELVALVLPFKKKENEKGRTFKTCTQFAQKLYSTHILYSTCVYTYLNTQKYNMF